MRKSCKPHEDQKILNYGRHKVITSKESDDNRPC